MIDTEIFIVEADPNDRAFIQWVGEIPSIVDELLDTLQDREGLTNEKIHDLKTRIYKGKTAKVICQNLTAIMNASGHYRYFWQVVE